LPLMETPPPPEIERAPAGAWGSLKKADKYRSERCYNVTPPRLQARCPHDATAPRPRNYSAPVIIARDAFPAVARFVKAPPGVRERDDAYPIVFRIDSKRRVIRCRDDIQFIFQRRTKGGRWKDLGYFRNTVVLFERIATDIIRG